MPNTNQKRTEEELKKAVEAAAESAEAADKEASEGAKEEGEAVSLEERLKGISVDELLNYPALQEKIAESTAKAVSDAKTGWQAEADTLAGMSEEDKAKYLFEKEKSDLQAERDALERAKRVALVSKQLLEAGLPDLSAFIVAADDETTKANIATVSALLKDWKAKQLANVMRGEEMKDVKEAEKDFYTAEDIAKMSREEIRAALKAGKIDYSKL